MPILLDYPHPHVALVTIDNQPKRNAMSREMMAEIAALWDQLETSECRAIILTISGTVPTEFYPQHAAERRDNSRIRALTQ